MKKSFTITMLKSSYLKIKKKNYKFKMFLIIQK